MTRSAENRIASTFKFLKVLEFIPLAPQIIKMLYKMKTPSLRVTCFGIEFKHPIGIAAGLDRKGEHFHVIDNYGPSFVEIGPLRDVRTAIANLQKNEKETVIFANISNVELERSFSLIYDFVDVIVVNVSSTTTVSEEIDKLVTLRRCSDNYRPILFKISPDLVGYQREEIVKCVLGSGLDGLMVPADSVKDMVELSQGLVPVVAVGNFEDMAEVNKSLKEGVSLVAIKNNPLRYGPSYIKRILKYLIKNQNKTE